MVDSLVYCLSAVPFFLNLTTSSEPSDQKSRILSDDEGRPRSQRWQFTSSFRRDDTWTKGSITPNLLSKTRLDNQRHDHHWIVISIQSVFHRLVSVVHRIRHTRWGIPTLVIIIIMPPTLLFIPMLALADALLHLAQVIVATVPHYDDGLSQLIWIWDWIWGQILRSVDGRRRRRFLFITGTLLSITSPHTKQRRSQYDKWKAETFTGMNGLTDATESNHFLANQQR
jgi:hypothetical protein